MSERRPVRVVVVDDHDDLRLLMRMLIDADPRFEHVGEAVDGAAGLDAIAESMPDMVLLDLGMPGVDGIEVLDACRDQWPNFPIVAVLSGFNRAVMGPVVLDHGAVAYIEKGVTMGTKIVDELWNIWMASDRHSLSA